MQYLSLFTQSQLDHYTAARAGEQTLGQEAAIVNTSEDISNVTRQGY